MVKILDSINAGWAQVIGKALAQRLTQLIAHMAAIGKVLFQDLWLIAKRQRTRAAGKQRAGNWMLVWLVG